MNLDGSDPVKEDVVCTWQAPYLTVNDELLPIHRETIHSIVKLRQILL
jgi:hypothetical protein